MPKSLIQLFKPKTIFAAGVFGDIKAPPGVDKYTGTQGEGFFLLLNNILKLIIVAAGIFALLNFIIAGYEFMSAGGDTQKINKAWEKIWQSILGLVVTAGAFTVAAVVGQLIFKDPGAIINPKIYGP